MIRVFIMVGTGEMPEDMCCPLCREKAVLVSEGLYSHFCTRVKRTVFWEVESEANKDQKTKKPPSVVG